MKVWITFSSKIENCHYANIAYDVAEVFLKRKDKILCGGTNGVMMNQIQKVCQEYHTDYTCVTLACYREDLSIIREKYIVSSTFERTKKLYDMADIIVFLPGGTGSIMEIFASLEEHRTLLANKKMILYNDNGFFNPILQIIDKLVKEGFNDKNITENFIIVQNIDELKEKVSEEDE